MVGPSKYGQSVIQSGNHAIIYQSNIQQITHNFSRNLTERFYWILYHDRPFIKLIIIILLWRLWWALFMHYIIFSLFTNKNTIIVDTITCVWMITHRATWDRMRNILMTHQSMTRRRDRGDVVWVCSNEMIKWKWLQL